MSVLDASALKQFVDADPSAPVVMLNLVRFAPGGADKYSEYIEHFSSSGIKERYGVTIVYGGAGHPSLVADAGGDWDLVALFSYPTRRHFVDMVNDPDYQAFEHLRAEAVATAVLQPTTPAL
ncbi:hypothetical protein Y900_015415 [Mycolicibacterium aromaticivorans JS19b1 = JCM 16368]|uniref:DUF1330 domain-containing protein n=1 Tax=Mycolicibacterium aromaticivorans JS19b1 = JCM 16368 TaxID=1440774 RepID=A0A064CJ21_9MYCO|nr:hypothetical protein [Mycolicibacterium aromaticivorans]KDF00291.1 hypothetical protein Y900_015415 [Mycolicibacterium aromaticivorans JS19b1 = JCM 16368]